MKLAPLALHRLQPPLLATIGMYFLEAALLVAALSIYKGTAAGLQPFPSGKMGLLALAALLGAGLAIGLLFFAFRLSAANRRSRFWLPIMFNQVVVLFCFVVGEATLRFVARPHPLGVRIGATVLLPYDWSALVRTNLQLLERTRSKTAYYVEDAVLGWTVGPSRASIDGRYKSSAEGLRSENVGVRYAASHPRQRVLLFGNSFAFSEEVPFEDSLGRHLEQALSPGTQVLNFGVPGYGVDQALLRLRREAVNWAPRVAILSFVADDLYRNANVYLFFKLGWERPFSKPRFVLNDGTLKLLNVPNLSPDRIFASRSIFDLPLLDYDIEFAAHQWQRGPMHASYVVRHLISTFPRWPARNSFTSDPAVADLGSRVIEEFVVSTRAMNATPIVVYFPSRGDFSGQDRSLKTQVIEQMRSQGVEVANLTECLLAQVSKEELFVANGHHYSGKGNAAVARCMRPMIAPALGAGG
jgi:hypothetical protein